VFVVSGTEKARPVACAGFGYGSCPRMMILIKLGSHSKALNISELLGINSPANF
jgi:hypothetical protein